MSALERCDKCGLVTRPRAYPVTWGLVMLTCKLCGAFWRYERR